MDLFIWSSFHFPCFFFPSGHPRLSSAWPVAIHLWQDGWPALHKCFSQHLFVQQGCQPSSQISNRIASVDTVQQYCCTVVDASKYFFLQQDGVSHTSHPTNRQPTGCWLLSAKSPTTALSLLSSSALQVAGEGTEEALSPCTSKWDSSQQGQHQRLDYNQLGYPLTTIRNCLY